MAYDENAAERVRELVVARKGVSELNMFGGVGFTLNGNMFIGVVKNDLVVRFPAEETDALMAKPHVRPMDFTKRPMKGWAFVAPAGFKTSRQLEAWVEKSWRHASAMPPKKASAKKPMAKKKR